MIYILLKKREYSNNKDENIQSSIMNVSAPDYCIPKTAGICKSKWERNDDCPFGSYEYIDVEAGEDRYIVEILLAGEFTIARPTGGYTSLLNILPQIYVGREEELKKVVRVMCNGIKRSMKSAGMHVPPWRRGVYMKSKWFASYRRTTSQIPSSSVSGERLQKQSVVAGVQRASLRCREDFATRRGFSMGNLESR